MMDIRRLEGENFVFKVEAKTRGGITIAGMEFIFIPGGSFDMGDTFGDGDSDEKPVHTVRVADFYLGKTEVTNAQFAAFLNDYGRDEDDNGQLIIYELDWGVHKSINGWQAQAGYEQHPVVGVTWYGAAQFAKWAGCCLPTEAEWEYAARSGGKKEKWAGTSSESSLPDYAWYSSNSGMKTHAVASKLPNALGLYDMSGNVWEWCQDWYDGSYYQNSSANNPKGPSAGSRRVLRGGSWYNSARSCRSADRYGYLPVSRYVSDGFRVARLAE